MARPPAPIVVTCALEIERRALAGLERPGVEIHVSGMGSDAAAAFGATLLGRDVRALIATGFCGALSPTLRVGDLIAADRVVHENTGEAFPADEVLLAAAPGRRGTLVSATDVARTPADRAALAGLAVDLESAALARAAREANIPFVAMRAVSDRTRDRIPDIEPAATGLPDTRAVVAHLLRHPRDVVPLIRLRRATRSAGLALNEGVDTLLQRLGA